MTALALMLLLLPLSAAAQGADETAQPHRRTASSRDGTAFSPSSDRDRVSVRIFGGTRWLRGGDVNDGIANWTQSFESLVRNEVLGLQPGDGDDAAALRQGGEFDVDVLVHLTPRVAIVGGVGLMESSSDGTIEHAVVRGPFSSATRNATSLRVRAIPVRVGTQYSFPLGHRVSLAVEGGVGLYVTDLSWSHHLDVERRTSSWVSETRGKDVGIHGGVWVDVGHVGLSDRLGLVFGVEGARANIAD